MVLAEHAAYLYLVLLTSALNRKKLHIVKVDWLEHSFIQARKPPEKEYLLEQFENEKNTSLFHSVGVAHGRHLTRVLEQYRPYLKGYKPLCQQRAFGLSRSGTIGTSASTMSAPPPSPSASESLTGSISDASLPSIENDEVEAFTYEDMPIKLSRGVSFAINGKIINPIRHYPEYHEHEFEKYGRVLGLLVLNSFIFHLFITFLVV
ncbi:hypothetical protein PG988_007451 [Apiospora saccharicola]